MIDATLYRNVLGYFATGVTVVTVANGRGGIEGFTASAFSALSLEPPLVLVCLAYDSECYEPLRRERRYAIHFLNKQQTTLAYAFADRNLDKSQQTEWGFNKRGYAILQDALAVIECRLQQEYAGGDHAIFVGEVEAMEVRDGAIKPLVYFRGKLGGSEVF